MKKLYFPTMGSGYFWARAEDLGATIELPLETGPIPPPFHFHNVCPKFTSGYCQNPGSWSCDYKRMVPSPYTLVQPQKKQTGKVVDAFHVKAEAGNTSSELFFKTENVWQQAITLFKRHNFQFRYEAQRHSQCNTAFKNQKIIYRLLKKH